MSSLYWGFVLLSSVVLFPIAVLIWALTAPFDRRGVVLHLFTCFWASLYTWVNPLWRVRIEGRSKFRSDRACVVVANHRSLLDIHVMFRLFKHFKWVSKVENFKLPFIGWNMYLNGYIPLRRGNASSIGRMFELCRATLREGSSVFMFPEGKRSLDGELRRFKPGAFELALSSRRAILPIVALGTAEALPRKGYTLRRGRPIVVRVLDEIPYESFAGTSPEDLASRVRDLMKHELLQMESACAKVPEPRAAVG